MKKTCDACGGSGQLGSFRGVSRFVISWDECGECAGTGMINQNDPPHNEEKQRKEADGINSSDTLERKHPQKK